MSRDYLFYRRLVRNRIGKLRASCVYYREQLQIIIFMTK